jgi:tRNA pseudouridine55 synthase
MDGVLNINKPRGPTSHDVVSKVRKLSGEKKVGHAGTLDPYATGVLPVCLGKATKIVQFLFDEDKEYQVIMVLGKVTDTQDWTGKVLKTVDIKKKSIGKDDINEAFAGFRGEIEQTPPMFSAVRYKGRRLYEVARKGETVEGPPRRIHIYELEVLGYDLPEIRFRVVCSKGTYVRKLCQDIGEKLGVGGYQAELERTRVGKFSIANAASLEELEQPGKLEESLLSLSQALDALPLVKIRRGFQRAVLQGKVLFNSDLLNVSTEVEKGSLVRVASFSGKLLSIAKALVDVKENTLIERRIPVFKSVRVVGRDRRSEGRCQRTN